MHNLIEGGRLTDEALAAYGEGRLTAEEQALVDPYMTDEDRCALQDVGITPAWHHMPGTMGETRAAVWRLLDLLAGLDATTSVGVQINVFWAGTHAVNRIADMAAAAGLTTVLGRGEKGARWLDVVAAGGADVALSAFLPYAPAPAGAPAFSPWPEGGVTADDCPAAPAEEDRHARSA